jgi:heat shock protein HspQ
MSGRHSDPAGTARFAVGMVIRHRLFGYRGAIADVDADFRLSEAWYASMARSRPPRDEPWYRVLVDGGEHETYVAERNLERDDSDEPIRHPAVDEFFDLFEAGRYRPREYRM